MSSESDTAYTVVDSDDELDFLTPKSRTAASLTSGATTPTLLDPETPTTRRQLRMRPRKSNLQVLPLKKSLKVIKRKATLQDFAFTRESKPEHVAKRAKVEDRKAHTIVINSRRVAVEAARRRWLLRHRDLLSPLLPKSNLYLASLANEQSQSADKGSYKPLVEFDEQPRSVQNGTMKNYQLHGLSFLVWMYENGMNCILGDEMGLGKTLQTLSLFAHIKDTASAGLMDPHLIICPLSVVDTWIREINHWVPSFRVLRFHAQESERARLKAAVRDGDVEFDICVTTYEGYAAEDNWFKSRRWTYLVLDEGHRIKNSETQIAHKVQGIGSMYRLLLTGTPVQNNLIELWGLLHWLYPAVFTATTQRLFDNAFNLANGTYELSFLKATEKLLSTIMLRRTKDTVEGQISIPPREELTLFIPMTEAQRFWTYRLLTRLDTLDLEEIFTSEIDAHAVGRQEVKAHLEAHLKHSRAGGETQFKRLMNLLMQLRQICDHPYLISDALPDPFVNGEHVVASSSKLAVVDKLLADILPKGERVLIFSQWTGMLDLLEDFMALRSIPYARLDGSTPRPRRTLDIRLFQQDKSPYQVFIISTKAGGLGINLTKASTVIMLDSDWNPQNDLQAIARAHRIGQTKPVKVYRLICQGSVEDQMLDRIRRKLFLSVKVMSLNTSTAEENEQSTGLRRAELMSILRKGSSAISGAGVGMNLAEFLGASIDTILQASRAHDDTRALKLKKEAGDAIKEDEQSKLVDVEVEEKNLLQGVAQVHSRLFEGKVVNRVKQTNKDIAEEWQQLQKRASKARIVTIDGYEVLAEHLAPVVSSPDKKPKPRDARKKFEHEDWCMYCRDGGDLVLCTGCPRVVHPECHGLSKNDMKRLSLFMCPHHRCCECDRSTSDAGGMLFRCRTCPRAFCEDCLPPGDLDAVGDSLPELLVLGYDETPAAYYIQCRHCHERFDADPVYRKQWDGEFLEADEKLAALRASGN